MFSIPKLDYAYDALAPHIDAQTMEIHHTKHHQAYCDNANKALAGTEWDGKSTKEILTHLDALPDTIRMAVQNNVGGVCNHEFFWKIMSPSGGGTPKAGLAAEIDKAFGNFENFQQQFAAAALGRFGSGWAWLVRNGDGQVEIISTANQDSPLSLGKNRVLGLDVWEHAYYLNYQNRRPDYVKAWWNVVNWDQAEEWFNAGGI